MTTVLDRTGVLDLTKAARDYATKTKVGFSHDRSKTVGASEIGRCARMVGYEKRGTPADDDYSDMNGFAQRGNIMEDAWTVPVLQHAVSELGGELLYAGQHGQITFKGKGVPLSVTPDGLATKLPRKAMAGYGIPDLGKSREAVFELKSIDYRYDRGKLPKKPHIPQTVAQLGMIRAATKHRPEWGAVLYVDASDYFDIKVFPVKWDERDFRSLVRRASTILAATDPETLPPEGKVTGDCKDCKFHRRCLGYARWRPETTTAKFTAVQKKKLTETALKIKQNEEEEATARKKKAENEAILYELLAKTKTHFAAVPGIQIRWKEAKGSMRYDTKAMAEALRKKKVDPEQFRVPTKPSTRLEIERTS